MKQVYVQTDSEGIEPLSHDYDLEDGYLFTTLKYSNNNDWNNDIKGSLAGSLQDDGNGVIIKIEGMKKLELDYMLAQKLLILLFNNNEEKIEIRESKLIKSI
jgi:hypothetical protein